MFSFAPARPPRRRPGLTPMIDVVFLLLIFFMLAAQVGRDAALPLSPGGAGAAGDGPPRLVEIAPGGLALNGRPVTLAALPGALARLTDGPDDVIVLRPTGGVPVQRLIDVAGALEAAGFPALAVVE